MLDSRQDDEQDEKTLQSKQDDIDSQSLWIQIQSLKLKPLLQHF